MEFRQLKEPTRHENAKGNRAKRYTWAERHLHFKERFTAICQQVFCLPIIDPNNSQEKMSGSSKCNFHLSRIFEVLEY